MKKYYCITQLHPNGSKTYYCHSGRARVGFYYHLTETKQSYLVRRFRENEISKANVIIKALQSEYPKSIIKLEVY